MSVNAARLQTKGERRKTQCRKRKAASLTATAFILAPFAIILCHALALVSERP
jgi:hypothetical protein